MCLFLRNLILIAPIILKQPMPFFSSHPHLNKLTWGGYDVAHLYEIAFLS